MSLVYFSTFQMEARIFPYMLFVAIFFSSASAEKCKDTDTRCEGWANIGECTKNPIWMGRNCRKSCNKCEDDKCKDTRTEADCTFWQAQYYCHKSSRWHGFMKENCQKTCKFCGAKLPGDEKATCKDTYGAEQCAAWAKDGECTKNVAWMAEFCQKSCKKCPVEQSTHIVTDKSMVINEQTCGLRLKSFVVGGVDAAPGDWPWQVGLAKRSNPNRTFCGGSLINRQWVVTAGHCFGRGGALTIKQEDLVVRVGDYDLGKYEPREILSDVINIIRHESYGFASFDHDIALLKLAKLVPYNQAIKPICLPKQGQAENPGEKCYVTGWGRLAEYGAKAKILQEARLPIIAKDECKRAMSIVSPFSRYTDNMICAGYKEGGIDACQGDSGGPFSCARSGRYELNGIVSWGKGCAKANSYGVYTKVSNYINWIKKNIQQN